MTNLNREIAAELGIVECDKWQRFNSQSMMQGPCGHDECYPKQYGPPKLSTEPAVFWPEFEKWRKANGLMFACGFGVCVWFTVHTSKQETLGDSRGNTKDTLTEAGCKCWLAAMRALKGKA